MESITEKQRYRREQEEFILNHGGTTPREILLIILPNICAILLTSTVTALVGKYLHRNILTLIEFLLIIIPCVLCCTILSEYTLELSATILTIAFVNYLLIALISKTDITMTIVEPMKQRRSFVTNFRALVNIITAVCILAVDFKIFPRRFAKTEIYGYGLMDTGVGLFIIANALVAPNTRISNQQPKATSFLRKFNENVIECTKNSAILLLLGLGRFIAVEYTGYQQHITEYGVHWNFFVTLAFVKIFTSIIGSTISRHYSLTSGIWMIAMHEYTLSTNGLKEWVLGDAPRNDFVSANREGLVSVPGYVGLYFLGIAIGRLIHSTYNTIEQYLTNETKRVGIEFKLFGINIAFEYNRSMVLCIKLSIITPFACAVGLICDSYFGVSRRLANSGYCAWIITLSTALLTLLLLVEILTDILIHLVMDSTKVIKSPNKEVQNRQTKISNKDQVKISENFIRKSMEIFEAVNYNGLGFFLLSNLLTGIVNMCVKTLYVDTIQALTIIIVYIVTGTFVTVLLYRYKIQIKL